MEGICIVAVCVTVCSIALCIAVVLRSRTMEAALLELIEEQRALITVLERKIALQKQLASSKPSRYNPWGIPSED